jgi:hypothetical protein
LTSVLKPVRVGRAPGVSAGRHGCARIHAGCGAGWGVCDGCCGGAIIVVVVLRRCLSPACCTRHRGGVRGCVLHSPPARAPSTGSARADSNWLLAPSRSPPPVGHCARRLLFIDLPLQKARARSAGMAAAMAGPKASVVDRTSGAPAPGAAGAPLGLAARTCHAVARPRAPGAAPRATNTVHQRVSVHPAGRSPWLGEGARRWVWVHALSRASAGTARVAPTHQPLLTRRTGGAAACDGVLRQGRPRALLQRLRTAAAATALVAVGAHLQVQAAAERPRGRPCAAATQRQLRVRACAPRCLLLLRCSSCPCP